MGKYVLVCQCVYVQSRKVGIYTYPYIYGGYVGICILYIFAFMYRYESVGVCVKCEEMADSEHVSVCLVHTCVDV